MRFTCLEVSKLDPPAYIPTDKKDNRIFLAVEGMKYHTSDEGWQLALMLQEAGYELWGKCLENNKTNVANIVEQTDPTVLIFQDKREWEGKTAGQQGSMKYKFHNIDCLKSRNDIFKLTILKDAHQELEYHRQSAEEAGVHAWLVYYDVDTVERLAPYVRKEHLIRMYHTIDAKSVPIFNEERKEGVCSGALNPSVYPLRRMIKKNIRFFHNVRLLKHPGYTAAGAQNVQFMRTLNRYKVAICTSSIYGYALRKIIEATACGCRVITTLPATDKLPFIDANLVRVNSTIEKYELRRLVERLCNEYSDNLQRVYAEKAKAYYDWRVAAVRTSQDIDRLKDTYTW